MAGPLHATGAQRRNRVRRGPRRRRGSRRAPRQVGEQCAEAASGAGLQSPSRPVIELFLGETPGLEVLAQLGDRLVAFGV
jgi:hypothetical protein